MIKLVILDFDGTIVDSREVIYYIIKKVVEKYGYKLPKGFKWDMGKTPIKPHLREIKIKEKDIDKIHDEIVADFIASEDKIKLIKDADKIKEIKQKKMIITNNNEEFVRTLLKKLNIEFFEDIFSPKEFKEKADAIKHILKQKNIEKSEAMYVGDRDTDVLHANKAGVVSVAVSNYASWSKRKDLLKQNPDFIISDLGELKKIVDGL